MKIARGKEEAYQDWLDKNKYPYSRTCFLYAERWAELMEELISNSQQTSEKVIVDNAYQLSHEADKEFGITGFMFGCAVSILCQCWEYGELLEKWNHNGRKQEGK